MPKDYLTFAESLARRAGDTIRQNFKLGMRKEWKQDNTPLTAADLAINKLVIDSVREVYPKHSVLAEEGSDLREGSEYTWVCDPIDGTIAFSHGIPTATFAIALVHHGVVELGLIYDPFLERMFVGERTKGAFLNGKPIHVSADTNLTHKLVSVLWWQDAPYNLLRLMAALEERGALTIHLPAVLYVGALVANGEMAASIFPGDLPHDTAALKVIVEEAGGRVTSLFGDEQRYDGPVRGHLVTNGLVHDEILSLIGKYVT